jgi:hypothetical protein
MTKTIAPPREIVAAVAGQCISIAVGVGTFAVMGAFPKPWWGTLIFWTVLSGLLYLFFRALLRGANWVRWVLLVTAILGILGATPHLSAPQEQWRRVLFIFQDVVQVTTVALLFLPASSRWFSGSARA